AGYLGASTLGHALFGRRHAVGVEYRVEVPQADHAVAELVGVADLDHEPVADHRVLGRAASLEDVRPGLGEGAGQVLEEARAVVGVDLELDPVGGDVVAVPGDLGEALGGLAQGLDVAAVLAVDGDPAPERDVADDVVAG